MKTIPNPNPQWTSAGTFAACSARMALPMFCPVCGMDSSATMRIPSARHALRNDFA